jgi:hypothetical protein
MLRISNQKPAWNFETRQIIAGGRGEPTEFEIQAFLYSELKLRGYYVRGEVTFAGCSERLDLVIYGDEQGDSCRVPVRIIEVKRAMGFDGGESKCIDQATRYYERFGVPVDVVGGMHAARMYLCRIYQILPPDAFCEGWA